MTSFLIVITVISASCFTKVFTILNILRAGIGLNYLGGSVITLVISLAISLVVMQPTIKNQGNILASNTEKYFLTVSPFLERFTDKSILRKVDGLSKKIAVKNKVLENIKNSEPVIPPNYSVLENKSGEQINQTKPIVKEELSFFSRRKNSVLLASFLLSELQDAFIVGLKILLPLLAVDIVVINLLMILGVTQVACEYLSLPFKLFLFTAVNGWTMIAELIIREYS
jgi:flagellar biosynthesis protein FliP